MASEKLVNASRGMLQLQTLYFHWRDQSQKINKLLSIKFLLKQLIQYKSNINQKPILSKFKTINPLGSLTQADII